MSGETLKERVARLKETLGEWNIQEGTVFVWVNHAMNELNVQRGLMEKQDQKIKEKIVGLEVELLTVNEDFKQTLQTLQEDVSVLKKVVLQGSPRAIEAPPNVQVLELKGFDGTRSAKELKNFLWDMEQFFNAALVADKEKVSIISMHLLGDAKLWWRTKLDGDAKSGRPQITTENLKQELKKQFLPTNATWLARESLRRLKQTGTVREYVKEFNSLMLDIKNMSEEDKLFNFVSGLRA